MIKKYNPKKDINNIEHPHRALAAKIIDDIIEPRLNHGRVIRNEKYYLLEDEITHLINKELK